MMKDEGLGGVGGDNLNVDDPAQLALVKQMFAGARISVFIKFEGEITETDAKHKSKEKPVITVVDWEFDKILADPATMKAMNAAKDKEAVKALLEKGLPGVTMQDPTKNLTVKFK